MARTDIDKMRPWIELWLAEGTPRFEICRRLDCKYDTLKSRLDKWGVSTKNQSRKGRPHPEGRVHASKYLGTNKLIHSHNLRLILIRDGYKAAKCEICQNTHWQGKDIPLELDHINGKHTDNRLENLRILCPNCHAQTDTNSGKNIKKRKARVTQLA